MLFLPSEIIRKLDSETIASGVPGELLMERAGFGAFKFLKNIAAPNADRFLIFAGKGNNAGDAFVIARYLIQNDKFVEIICLADYSDYKGDAALNLQKLLKLSPRISVILDVEKINSFDWHGDIIIDGILGTGIRGEVKGIFKPAIQKINNLNIPVFSLDIPSGLNCDTGELCGTAVKAKWTAMFANPKLAVLTETGAGYCGRVEVIDIGISDEIIKKYLKENSAYDVQSTDLVDDNQQKSPIEYLKAHKNNFGHLLVIAGSMGMTGAAILTAKAAIKCGCGLVTLAVPNSILQLVAPAMPFCMTLPLDDNGKGYFSGNSIAGIIDKISKFDAVAIGPGIRTNKDTYFFFENIIPEILNKKVVIDADALNIIAQKKELLNGLGENVVLTPHPGEFERLSGVKPDKTDSDRITLAKQFVKNKKISLLLKGFHTVITNSKSENVKINLTGNPGMATAGSGDVLTGIIGAYLARGFSPEEAASRGAFIHGLAGDIVAANLGEASVTSEEIIRYLGKANFLIANSQI